MTAGTYYFTQNVVAKNAARAGGQFAFDQRITPKVSFATEWMTGRHANGNLTAGFKWKVNKRTTGIFAYTIANDRALQGNNYFFTSLAINFN